MSVTASAPDLSAWVKSSRNSLGLDQAQFGKALGSHQVSVSKWETGKMQPRSAAIARIERLLTGEIALPPPSKVSAVAQRILDRLSAIEKSASAASSEAGLGRTLIRDIVAKPSLSPSLSTLEKLCRPLQCSLAYLVGITDDPGDPPAEPSNSTSESPKSPRDRLYAAAAEFGRAAREIDPKLTDWQLIDRLGVGFDLIGRRAG